jgi:DNA-binding CsgD family transcriptional regulator
MRAPVTASERDLRALAGIVTEDRSDLPAGEGLPPSLLDDLLGLIPSDCLSILGIDSGRQENWFGYDFPVRDFPVDDFDIAGDASPEEFWDNYWASDSCSYPDRTGDLRSVTKISDFYSARQWHSTGMYRDTVRLAGFEHQLTLCLPAGPVRIAGPGQSVRLLFSRGPGLDFSERDRAVLTLLRPHLHQAYLHAERHRQGTLQLTRRQWEVLRLAAAGHTNAQIARQLGVSEGTVRIHLQNIYGRLRVSSRTAAVTHAFPGLATG